MIIKIIEYGSNAYEQMIALRTKVLRKPLGLHFSEKDLQRDKEDILIGAFDREQFIGCCILTPKDSNMLQLRQMAVDTQWQQQGVGAAIIATAENLAKEKGYTTVMMHSRNVAVEFYKKCGYAVSGDEFTEVGIPHFKMEKRVR